MDRLTTRNSVGVAVFTKPVRCDRCGEEEYQVYPDFDGVLVTDALARYEEAEEQERLVFSPCKADDTVYIVCNGELLERVVDYIEQHSQTTVLVFKSGNRFTTRSSRNFDIGETLFFTRKEAESALEEGCK
jgi:hypothetical protein